MSSTAEYLTQAISDRNDLADNLVTMGVQASRSETITNLVPKVLDISGGGTDWGDTITDDWATIITNANAGTVSGYSIGDTKTLEFIHNGIPLAIRCILVGKSHDTISGTTDKAALSFNFNDLVVCHNMNTTNSNAGGYMGENGDFYATSLDETSGELVHGSEGRKFLWRLYNSFPTELKNAIKTVDKIYDDSNELQTAKEKLFLPSLIELGLSTSAALSGQGTAYEYFSSAAQREKKEITVLYYFTRSRVVTSTANFLQVRLDNGNFTSAAAGTRYGFAPCFCI